MPTPPRPPSPRRGGWRTSLVAVLLAIGPTLGSCATPAAGQEREAADPTPVGIMVGGMAAYVDGLVGETAVWRGQRVPFPTVEPRPASEVVGTSFTWPVAVHGRLDAARAARWIEGLEHAFERLSDEGWPLPPPDGGRGETDGLDLYVIEATPLAEDDGLDDPGTASRHERRSGAAVDAPLFDATHDAAIVHAWVADDVPDDRIEGCALQLVASAGLLAADPAEAQSLREATAAWLAWNETGELGCDEDAFVRQQTSSFRAFVTRDPRDAEGAALFLGAMAARHDGRETSFLRDVWLMARQRTRDHGDLQGEPDVLRMLGQASTLAHDPMDRVVESLAVSRYFAGGREGAARPDVPILRALPDGARVPVFVSSAWARLPRTLRPGTDTPPLEPWGSAYARIDVREAPRGAQLRVWLEGELGTEWSLVAVRLDAEGRERGRTRAPPTRGARSFIPVELGEDTAEVVLVVTNLPDDDDPRDRAVGASADARIAGRVHRTGLDADVLGPGPHGFRLIVDRGP